MPTRANRIIFFNIYTPMIISIFRIVESTTTSNSAIESPVVIGVVGHEGPKGNVSDSQKPARVDAHDPLKKGDGRSHRKPQLSL